MHLHKTYLKHLLVSFHVSRKLGMHIKVNIGSSQEGEGKMYKLDRMQKSEDDKSFEIWTKELEKELPNFWNEFLKSRR